MSIRQMVVPENKEDGNINGRVPKYIETLFAKMYAKHKLGKYKYSKGKLLTIAILLLNKMCKRHKVRVNDDIAQKIGL